MKQLSAVALVRSRQLRRDMDREEPRRVTDVLLWAREAEIGARVVYHRGTGVDTTGAALGLPGVTARLAHQEGLVFLAQRRVKQPGLQSVYHYEATRISTPCAKALRIIWSDL